MNDINDMKDSFMQPINLMAEELMVKHPFKGTRIKL